MFRNPFPDVFPRDVSLPEFLLTRIEQHANKDALVDALTGQKYTYNEITHYIRTVSSGLVRRGLRKGDIIAFFIPNRIEFAILFLASLSTGATAALVNSQYTHYELNYHLKSSDATWVVTTKQLIPTVRKAAETYHNIKGVFTIEPTEGCTSFGELASDKGDCFPSKLHFDSRNDVAVLLFSSGTTGLPKPVMLTHHNCVSHLLQLTDQGVRGERDPKAPQEVIWSVLPFFHAYGFMIINLLLLYDGNKLISLPKFQPSIFLNAIQKFKVTTLPIVPPIMVFLAKSDMVQQYDLSSIRKIRCGGSAIDQNTVKIVKEKFRNSLVYTAYGMTEATASITTSGQQPMKQGSVGLLRPNMEAKIVNPQTSKLCEPYETGELWLRGPNIMKGYYKNPEATRQTLDTQGFVHSGDIVYRDEEGWLFIVGRIKELVKYKGFQVAPAELEGVIRSHPGVGDAAVVGVPDKDAGELPRGYVVMKPGKQLTADDLDKYVTERVAPFKRLRGGIIFVDEIPKSHSGKIPRGKLTDILHKKGKL